MLEYSRKCSIKEFLDIGLPYGFSQGAERGFLLPLGYISSKHKKRGGLLTTFSKPENDTEVFSLTYQFLSRKKNNSKTYTDGLGAPTQIGCSVRILYGLPSEHNEQQEWNGIMPCARREQC